MKVAMATMQFPISAHGTYKIVEYLPPRSYANRDNTPRYRWEFTWTTQEPASHPEPVKFLSTDDGESTIKRFMINCLVKSILEMNQIKEPNDEQIDEVRSWVKSKFTLDSRVGEESGSFSFKNNSPSLPIAPKDNSNSQKTEKFQTETRPSTEKMNKFGVYYLVHGSNELWNWRCNLPPREGAFQTVGSEGIQIEEALTEDLAGKFLERRGVQSTQETKESEKKKFKVEIEDEPETRIQKQELLARSKQFDFAVRPTVSRDAIDSSNSPALNPEMINWIYPIAPVMAFVVLFLCICSFSGPIKWHCKKWRNTILRTKTPRTTHVIPRPPPPPMGNQRPKFVL